MKLRPLTHAALVFLAVPVMACTLLHRHQPFDWHVTLEIDQEVPDREAATNHAVTTLDSRLSALGLSNYDVKPLPNGRILVSLPNVSDRERLKSLLSSEGQLEISHLVSPPSPAPAKLYDSKEAALASFGGKPLPNRLVLPYTERQHAPADARERRWGVVEAPAIVASGDLRNATAVAGSNPDEYTIAFSLRPEGAEKFGAWTGAHISEYVAVIYNGEIKSVAFIKSQINDQGEISGRFTRQSAEDIALILKSGALPKVKIIEEGNN
ncbi:MAG TPA: hypothetical protein VLL54_01740 [Pyrinomonadaceae bacterium]|nr:hypothetical protein [Pyrinomonadaceae bacterium]